MLGDMNLWSLSGTTPKKKHSPPTVTTENIDTGLRSESYGQVNGQAVAPALRSRWRSRWVRRRQRRVHRRGSARAYGVTGSSFAPPVCLSRSRTRQSLLLHCWPLGDVAARLPNWREEPIARHHDRAGSTAARRSSTSTLSATRGRTARGGTKTLVAVSPGEPVRILGWKRRQPAVGDATAEPMRERS